MFQIDPLSVAGKLRAVFGIDPIFVFAFNPISVFENDPSAKKRGGKGKEREWEKQKE